MPDVRYVCVSDLHFGAENSILTRLLPDRRDADILQASAALTGLIDGLRTLISANEGHEKPVLILNGDVLELALTTDDIAIAVFGQFATAALGGSDPLFDTIHYVPGNHDHHMWEAARERQYRDYVAARPLDQAIEPPWHTTKLFHSPGDPPVEAELLTMLVKRFTRREHVIVQTIYPNHGLVAKGGDRCVIFHHGHYIESLYRLMSTLKDYAFPERDEPSNVWDIEAENFAWVDFFWSTLGRSGDVGTDIGLAYEMLQSQKALRRLSDTIAGSIQKNSTGAAWRRWLIGQSVRRGLHKLIPRVTKLERSQPNTPLSPRAEVGLAGYLDGPLRLQLLRERNDTLPPELTFVFGHTHKPFEQDIVRPLYPGRIQVLNTGGWVVDALENEPVQGGAVVMLDEELNAISLRMFNEAATPADYRVSVRGVASEFRDRISGLVDQTAAPWSTFSTAAAGLVAERQRALADTLRNAENGIWR